MINSKTSLLISTHKSEKGKGQAVSIEEIFNCGCEQIKIGNYIIFIDKDGELKIKNPSNSIISFLDKKLK